MNSLDQQEWGKWSNIRSKGKWAYIFRWVTYGILFISLIRATLYMTSSKEMDRSDIVAFITVAILIGITVGWIRWSTFERRYNNPTRTSKDIAEE
ncbi:hypothetical protein CHH75_00305 [Paenibacillus sp. 7541]|nr:hypothetical protein CHH75_00305 [Paenibacillus sp. 7541]